MSLFPDKLRFGIHLFRKLAGGVDVGWKLLAVRGEELLRKPVEVVCGGNPGLRCEDGTAVLVGEGGRDFLLQITRVD